MKETWMSKAEAEYQANWCKYLERVHLATKGWQVNTNRIKEFENNPDQEILFKEIVKPVTINTDEADSIEARMELANYFAKEANSAFFAPSYREVLRELFLEIEHGDQEHRDWLKNKIEDFIIKKGF